MILGIGLMAANGLILAWWALIAVAVLMVVIPREERALVERFGAEYTTYQRETGRLVPRL